jgi:hypothetical protein
VLFKILAKIGFYFNMTMTVPSLEEQMEHVRERHPEATSEAIAHGAHLIKVPHIKLLDGWKAYKNIHVTGAMTGGGHLMFMGPPRAPLHCTELADPPNEVTIMFVIPGAYPWQNPERFWTWEEVRTTKGGWPHYTNSSNDISGAPDQKIGQWWGWILQTGKPVTILQYIAVIKQRLSIDR